MIDLKINTNITILKPFVIRNRQLLVGAGYKLFFIYDVEKQSTNQYNVKSYVNCIDNLPIEDKKYAFVTGETNSCVSIWKLDL